MARSVGAVAERIHTPATAREDTLRAVVAGAARPPDGGAQPADRRAGRALRPATSRRSRCRRRRGRCIPIQPACGALADAHRQGAAPARSRRPRRRDLGCGGSARRRWRIAPARCWPRRCAGTACSPAIPGRSASAAASPRRRRDELISESDLILAFGASLTHWTTKRGKLIAPGAVVAQVDVETAKLGYQMPVQHRRARRCPHDRRGDPGRAGRAPDRRPHRLAQRARRASASTRATTTTRPIRTRPSDRFIDPRTLSKAVDAILPKERVVASDSGHFCGWVPRYLRVPNAQRLVPQPLVPVGRAGARFGHRARHRQSGRARRAWRRRRRLPDVASPISRPPSG